MSIGSFLTKIKRSIWRMPDGYYELAEIIAELRESYGKDIIKWPAYGDRIRISSLPDVPNQCAVFAGALRDKLDRLGIDNEFVVVKTPGSKEWDHLMVKSGQFYMDNNSWWPYMRGGFFGDLAFYKFQEYDDNENV